MLKEIIENVNEASRKSEQMKKVLLKELRKAGLEWSDDGKINHFTARLDRDVTVGVASEFHDQYTVYDNGVEQLNTPSIDKLMDYLYKVMP